MTIVECWAGGGDHRLLGDPGVDKKNIDLAEPRAHLVEEFTQVFFRSDIALEAQVFAAEVGQRFVDRLLVTANQRDSGAFLIEELARCPPNATIAAGNHRDLAFEFSCCRVHLRSLMDNSVQLYAHKKKLNPIF